MFAQVDGILSWGRAHRFRHLIARPAFRDMLAGLLEERRRRPLLPVGSRRSYGDSCLNANGALIEMSCLDRIIAFDAATGILEAEAGISLRSILEFAIPRGFFLPVVPGTQEVTLGGAIANDVHGKNHLNAGSFGNAVLGMEVLRTDGSMQFLTRDDATGLFAATVGGLGLTGIISRATLRLRRIASTTIESKSLSFGDLPEYFALAREHAPRHAFTVAWIAGIGGEGRGGRGIFTFGDFSTAGGVAIDSRRRMTLPFGLPSGTLGRGTALVFNVVYRRAVHARGGRRRVSYRDFLFPLDGISNWNRLYGRGGMYQHQSALPPHAAEEAIPAMLRAVEAARHGAFLGVLKSFGPASSGMLSFPMEGTTLALDFPNLGERTLALLARLDAIAVDAGGRIYAAKDGNAAGATFRKGYPKFDQFAAHVDPGLSSSFWRRVVS